MTLTQQWRYLNLRKSFYILFPVKGYMQTISPSEGFSAYTVLPLSSSCLWPHVTPSTQRHFRFIFRPRLLRLLSYLSKKVPLARFACDPLQNYLPVWQKVYFYLWSDWSGRDVEVWWRTARDAIMPGWRGVDCPRCLWRLSFRWTSNRSLRSFSERTNQEPVFVCDPIMEPAYVMMTTVIMMMQ